MDQNTIEEGKTIAIISYMTIIGLIIAYIMNNDKKNPFASFHIRQMIGLVLLGLIDSFVISRISATLAYIIYLGIIVLWVIGLMGAAQGQMKKVPVLGDYFQDWFKGIG
jgi:uncharacterized membrane protein